METNDILRRAPTAMRPILQVVLERVDELEAIAAKQAKEITALKKRLNTPVTPKSKKEPENKEEAEETAE